MLDILKPSPRNDRRSQGFTLIELLVVIAIIAILAAILFPVFAKAREKARQTTCLSNEKQIDLGMLQYIQDFDEAWPAATVTDNIYSGDPKQSWAYAIQPYIKSSDVWVCPDDPTDPLHTGGGRVENGFTTSQDIPRTYTCVVQFHDAKTAGESAGNIYAVTAMMSLGFAGAATPTSPNIVITDASSTEPSNTIWLLESGLNFNGATKTCYDNPCTDAFIGNGESGDNYAVGLRANWLPGGPGQYTVATYHTGGTNWGYADGHVKWALIQNLENATNAEADSFIRVKS